MHIDVLRTFSVVFEHTTEFIYVNWHTKYSIHIALNIALKTPLVNKVSGLI